MLVQIAARRYSAGQLPECRGFATAARLSTGEDIEEEDDDDLGEDEHTFEPDDEFDEEDFDDDFDEDFEEELEEVELPKDDGGRADDGNGDEDIDEAISDEDP